MIFLDPPQRLGRQGDGRGAARADVDQRHLAENAVCLEGLEMTIAASDLHLSTHDNEELVATIALPEDRLAFGKIARRKPGAQEMMETDFRFWHFAIPMRLI